MATRGFSPVMFAKCFAHFSVPRNVGDYITRPLSGSLPTFQWDFTFLFFFSLGEARRPGAATRRLFLP